MTRSATRRALGTILGGLRELFAVRWIRWATVLLLLALTVRVGLEQLLATTLNRLVAERGLVCEWEDLDLSLLSGRGEIHELRIRPIPAEEDDAPNPLLDVEYAVFDLNIGALFAGKLSIARAEVDGLDSWWIRESNGEWNVGHHVSLAEILALTASAPAAEEDEESDAAGPLDLASPLGIEALRFQQARCRIIDRAVDPPTELVLQVNAGLSYLNDPERPARFSATLLGGALVDAAHVEGTATWTADEIVLELRAQAGSIRLREIARYLEPLDIHPVAESLEANLAAKLHISVAGEERDELRARAELTEIYLNADGVECLALDRFLVQMDSLSSRGASLPGIEVEGLRGRASLESDASLRIAGVDFSGLRWLEGLSAISGEETPRELERDILHLLAPLFEQDPGAFPWTLGSLDVRAGLLDFTDRTVEPAASFPLHVDSISVGEIVHAPGTQSPSIPVNVALRAPGVAESIELKGALGPFPPRRSVDLDLQVDDIVLTSLSGRLEQLGVERDLQGGSFHARLVGEAETDASGRTTGHLALDRVALADGENLFGIESISATELLLDPAERLLRLGDVEISGTRLSAGRDPSRRFFAFGLRTLGFTPETSPVPAPVPDEEVAQAAEETVPGAPSQVAARPARIELGRLAWVNSDVEFVDQMADPPRRFSLDELGVELTNLTLGGDPSGPAYEPARFSARVVAPDLFDELTVEGLVHTQPGPLEISVELALRGSGGRGELIRPYLRALGLEPLFSDAAVAMDLQASVKQAPDGWRVGASISDASLHDGEELLLSCDELGVEDLRVGSSIEVGSITVVAPTARARRDESGELVLAGVRLVSTSEAPAPAVDAQDTPLRLPELPDVRVHQASLTGARVFWNDATFAPELATELVIDAAAHELGTDATPGTFEARLHVPETLERLDVQGSLTIGSQELGLTAEVVGEGVQPGPLARLLPAGIQLASSAGRLRGTFEARVSPAEEGGLQASVEARDCAWGEADAEPWIALASARLVAPRVDPAAGELRLGPITAEGLTVEVERDAEGTLHLLGLALQGAPPASASDVEEPQAEEQEEVASGSLVLPRIELVENVDLQLERLRFRDASLGAEALPLELTAGVQIETPLVAVSAEPQELDPIHWRIEGSLAGLVEHWSLSGQLAPFAPEPGFEAAFAAEGVRTAGVVERAPRLAEMLEGELEQGTLAASMNGTLFVRRTSPTDLGLSHPFSGELRLEGVEFRDRPGGTVLAGVDQVTADIERVDSAKGLVHLDTIEILRPRGALRRKDMTLHALGFAVHLDAGGSEPETSEATSLASAAEPVEAAVAVDEKAGAETEIEAPASELRIDQIVVSGIDFELLDETAEPAVRLPLTKLDAEVKRFTTRALVEKRPIQFSSYLSASPEDSGPGVFEEVALTGRVSLFPAPAGWAQLSMTGLELPELAPLAAMQGLTIDDGALDANVRVRLKGEQGVGVDASLVFTDLSLSEPEGGLLESMFSLPMGLDSALFLLKNSDGEHRFSTGFEMDEAGISGTEIASAATRAFAEVLTRALAAVPLRLLGALIPGGDEDEPQPRQTWTLAFAPGATELDPSLAPDLRAARTALDSKRDSVLVLSHELTAADVAYAEQLANPSESTCLELVRGLRQRKSELLRARDRTAIDAQALYAIGDDRALEAGEELRSQERELASVENALDSLLEILRSDSDRMRLKRTRSTAREIAELRLESIRESLLRNLLGSARDRIEVRTPRFEVAPGEGGGRVLIELRER